MRATWALAGLLTACGAASTPRASTEARARPTHHVTSVCFSPEGSTLAAGLTLGTVALWDARSGAARGSLGPHPGPVRATAWARDASTLAAAAGPTVSLWDRTGALRASLSEHPADVVSLAWSPDGSRLASGARDEVVRIWDVPASRLLRALEPPAARGPRLASAVVAALNVISSLAWSPDAATLAVASRDEIRLRDAGTGAIRATLEGHASRVETVAYSVDGSKLASGGFEGTVRIWDAASGQLVSTLPGSRTPVVAVTWSPDGARLVSASDDGTLRIWDPETATAREIVHADPLGLTAVAWSPDGTVIATGGYAMAVTLWDARTGVRQGVLRVPD